MLWASGALFLLLAGGLTGMMLAIPAINYTVHNSVFVIAHFHCMVLLIVYAIFAAVSLLVARKCSASSWMSVAANGSSGPSASAPSWSLPPCSRLGFMGETRRLDYLYDTAWFPALVIEEIGIGFYLLSCLAFFAMLFVSIRDRARTSCRSPIPGAPRARWNG